MLGFSEAGSATRVGGGASDSGLSPSPLRGDCAPVVGALVAGVCSPDRTPPGRELERPGVPLGAPNVVGAGCAGVCDAVVRTFGSPPTSPIRSSFGSAAALKASSLKYLECAFSPAIIKTGLGDISLMYVKMGIFINDKGVVAVQEFPEFTER